MNLNDFSKHILCPTDNKCYPQAVKHVYGNVENSENILSGDTKTVVLRYDGDTAPKMILDLGEASTGGYPVFKVKSFGGAPVLRLAYSDWYDYMMEEKWGEIGDFKRGCCKYLGVELPVLPGDPNRFNLFSITHEGEYISPLVQGQERWLMIKLDTPNTYVELEYAYIYYTSDASRYDGAFECSNKDLTKLWYASVWTCQIATIPNSQSWDTLNGTLLLRALTKGNDAGYYKNGTSLKNYKLTCKMAFANNPQMSSGFGVLLRADSIERGYAVFVNDDNTVKAYKRAQSVFELICEAKLDFDVIDNKFYDITATAEGNRFTFAIDGKNVLNFTDDTYSVGSFGFCQTTEKWALAKDLKVFEGDKLIFADDFTNGLDAYEFTRSAAFVSDGAKRDRLPWIGDLDWAGRNIYYAFKDFKAMPDTLRMFAFNQTPEGYVWGTCYPENTLKPEIGNYGYYESDLFSAWIVPTLADYLLFTGDTDFCKEIYGTIQSDCDYLWRFVEADGLFNQRYATSKGVWDHVLNDMGKFTYSNLLVSEAFGEAAFIAEHIGKADDAAKYNQRKKIMRDAIKKYFTSEEGYLTKGLYDRDMCELANSLALSIHYFDTASDATPALKALLARTPGHAKIAALMIRGAYMYGFDEEAIKSMILPGYQYVEDVDSSVVYDALDNPNFDFASRHMHPANWIKALNDWRGPHTTWECMTYPPARLSNGGAWGDRSHPDTAIAHILTGYVLGVLPETIGFETFKVIPHTALVDNAKGIVPTKFGNIYVEWNKADNVLKIDTDGTNKLIFDKSDTMFDVIYNGKKL